MNILNTRYGENSVMRKVGTILIMFGIVALFAVTANAGVVKIGLNYPETGPYSVQGLDQFRAASLAIEEINAQGGILGKQVELVTSDSKSKPDLTKQNVANLIDQQGVEMVFGGSSSAVAIAAGEVCQSKNTLFFGTLTYSNSTTDKNAHRYTFRECYNAWMAAKAIGDYLKTNFTGKKYLYITADYTWGWSTEESVRKFTDTENSEMHKGVLTPLGTKDFNKQLSFAKMVKPDVLVLVLFGKDMSNAIRQATAMGLKRDMQIVVPNLTLGMAEGGGPKVMEGVIGALPWCWQVPYKYGYEKGKAFVEKFAAKHNRYPSTSGASAYAIMYEYKEAVERAGSFEPNAIIKTLEGHKYQHLKDQQYWRAFDHQSIQSVFAVKCKAQAEVLKDKFKLDYFEIISKLAGPDAARTRAEWEAVRKINNLAVSLEDL
jgi:branched-chain amino acid transport system substrate-binding protein